MGKKKKAAPAPSSASTEVKPATLKDLLNSEVLDKLKAQASEMKAAEVKKREDDRKQAEEARKAEQKRLEGNFEYLLNNSSMDWKKFK
ncbi:YqkE family protein [Paenibacillus sp. GCM10012307]|uniref:YqkE family protein n=1 Tax=Paenibacillus roseus TaxID=2798579 RepID=A0A934J8W5_9BACL|nr:YqkE family protein [Paenibacillus roseus]MBJ6362587.1 YqkE family protein [Paenibacillus roseus]